MDERPASGSESMEIISRMISTAQGNVQSLSFYFLLWGWIVALANLGQFVLAYFSDYPHPYIVWLAAIPGFFVSFWHGSKKRREQRVWTHIDVIIGKVWIGFVIVLFIILLSLSKVNYQANPLIFLAMGTATFITGSCIRFNPLVFGGIIFWILGGLSFWVGFEMQSLVGFIGVVLGYLIPGYLLRKKELG